VPPRRPKGLAPIDPLSIELPHGTEVTCRVPRMLGERRVPKGVVGRVVKVREGGSVDVAVTGYGVLTYERDEVRPRKPGQVRFARRRQADWEALRPCAILEATVGSRAWGLSDEGSETTCGACTPAFILAPRARRPRTASSRRRVHLLGLPKASARPAADPNTGAALRGGAPR
jgi:hypothetical protein